MSWARIDDRANEHRKMLEAGAEACWLWVCGLMYANRQDARDGFIPAAVLTMLYPFRAPRKLAEKLVEVELWRKVPGGYQIHDYHGWNPTREQVAAEREKGRARAAKSYDRRRSHSSGEELSKRRRSAKDSSASLLDPLHSTPDPPKAFEVSAKDLPGSALDPSVPIELPPDWDPGAAILDGTPAAGVHNHERSLARFRAHHAGSGVTRTPMQWRQAFRVWATKDAQHDRSRPPAKATPQRQPDDPNVDLSVFELPWDDPRRAVLTGGGS